MGGKEGDGYFGSSRVTRLRCVVGKCGEADARGGLGVDPTIKKNLGNLDLTHPT